MKTFGIEYKIYVMDYKNRWHVWTGKGYSLRAKGLAMSKFDACLKIIEIYKGQTDRRSEFHFDLGKYGDVFGVKFVCVN